ncbi:NAD(P)-binding protein [Salmonella enterica]|nr:NAD(P)-binding protein [Salmonella enterica]
MTRYTTTDVLICGAGVTGLTLAIELARRGISFRLIEKRITPARRGLRIYHIGEQDELIDTMGHFRESYQLVPGECVLIRPDGYVGAFFHGKQVNDIENYLSRFAIGIKNEY